MYRDNEIVIEELADKLLLHGDLDTGVELNSEDTEFRKPGGSSDTYLHYLCVRNCFFDFWALCNGPITCAIAFVRYGFCVDDCDDKYPASGYNPPDICQENTGGSCNTTSFPCCNGGACVLDECLPPN